MFRILEHTADIGFEATAASRAGLFAEAVRAFAAIAFEQDTIAPASIRTVDISGDDEAERLINTLEEVLYLFDAGIFATRDCDVDRRDDDRLLVHLRGEPRDTDRHRWRLMIKAVTYHGLDVGERDGAWRARVFLDV